MVNCALCNKKAQPGNGTFFAVPKDDKRRMNWSAICRKRLNPSSRICVDHFDSSQLITAGRKQLLLPIAEPKALSPPPQQMPSFINNENIEPTNMEADEFLYLNNSSLPWTANSVLLEPNLLNNPACSTNDLFVPWTANAVPTTVVQTCKTFVNQETQTDPDIFAAESAKYVEKIRTLEREKKDLRVELLKTEMAYDGIKQTVNKIFTEGQIRKLEGSKKIVWRWADISNAICLNAAGPRAYNHLYHKGFPLPHVTTLQRWCQKINIDEGILNTSICFMKQAVDLALDDKICILAFDEMKVAESFEYDFINDVVRQPKKYVQVVMARGLKKSWKQPVFYDFDCKMTRELLISIIFEVSKAGFPVVAVVCDMGPTNRKLWSDLGITKDKPWFPHPLNSEDKVFTFVDAPHLLKLVRNHYLDTGVICNGEHLTPRTIADVLKHTGKSDASITFKLNDEHLLVKGTGRQKVKLAAQLFSHTTASAIRRCYAHGLDIYKPIETAEFIQTVNDWFDVLNSSMNTFGLPGKEPYGNDLENQEEKLHKMNQIMSVPIVPGKKSLELFQKGILITNSALVMLHEYLKKFGMTYILTNRLNQDILEHFFGAIRSKGGLNDHPSPQDFKYRLRKYILARNTELLSGRGNVENDETEWLNSTSNNLNRLESLPEVFFESEEVLTDDFETSVPTPSQMEYLDGEDLEDIGILQEDALEYISGYMIRKLNLEEYQCHENTFTWVDEVSKGSLKKPSTNLLEKVKQLEKVFYRINGTEISDLVNLRQHLVDQSLSIDLPDHVKQFYFKCRIFFRIRFLNNRLKFEKKTKAIASKKMKKIVL